MGTVIQWYRHNKTEEERTITFGGGLAGQSLWEINAALNKAGYPNLHPRSYKHVMEDYVPYFKADMSRLPTAIKHPPSLGEVKRAMRRTA